MSLCKRKTSFLILFLTGFFSLFSQEVLKSFQENYYEFLILDGLSSRNYITYRSLSNAIYETEESSEELIWNKENLSGLYKMDFNFSKSNWFLNGINQNLMVKLHGPDWYNSYNSKAPFGQNDGALWQGRGYNSSFSTGATIKAFGLEITVKPQMNYSQNLDFDIMELELSKTTGYSEYSHWYLSADSVQRYGDSAFSQFDFGDTDIRYNFYNFTIGFGTQAVWIGPAILNPMLLSNNAASFPKLDIGLNRTRLYIPFTNIYAGDIEFHTFTGQLQESDYYDSDSSNDLRQFTLFSLSYAPSFMEGFSLGITKTCMNYWGDSKWIYYLNPFYSDNTLKTSTSSDVQGEDQKVSFTFDWIFEKVGLETYAELAIDDFLPGGFSFYEYARYPFHTMAYTVGLRKSFNFKKYPKVKGLLEFEWNSSEGSRDYYNWPAAYNFGTHYQVKQGHTNKGQWLGSGLGYGGNSQYLSYTLYSPHGYDKFFIGRNNPDNGYVNYQILWGTSSTDRAKRWFTAYKANFYTGVETLWFLPSNLTVKGAFVYNLIINPLYNPGLSSNGAYREYTYWHNFHINLELNYRL